MGHEGLRDDDGDGKTITPYHMAKRITTYQDRDPYYKEFYELTQKLGAEIDCGLEKFLRPNVLLIRFEIPIQRDV